MFVNYMPFLIMGFIGIDKYIKESRITCNVYGKNDDYSSSYIFSGTRIKRGLYKTKDRRFGIEKSKEKEEIYNKIPGISN